MLKAEAEELLISRRGVAGFTLIELVVAMVLIGILASMAVRQLDRNRKHAYVSTMKSDLRNFSLAEESHLYDNGVYASSTGDLSGGFRISAGVRITVSEATSNGWSAVAEHSNTAVKCYVYSGSAAPVGGAEEPGVVSCL